MSWGVENNCHFVAVRGGSSTATTATPYRSGSWQWQLTPSPSPGRTLDDAEEALIRAGLVADLPGLDSVAYDAVTRRRARACWRSLLRTYPTEDEE